MKSYAQFALAGAFAVGEMSLIGCTVHTHEPDVIVREAPAAYVYDDDYYGRGHWDGDYWAWRDREGHFYRERREMREQRMREHIQRGGRDGHEHEEHEHR